MPLNSGEVPPDQVIDVLKKEGVGVSQVMDGGRLETVLRKGPHILPIRPYGTPPRYRRRTVEAIARTFNIGIDKFYP